ncbi:DUF924 domain-containing protein [Sphingomonas sp. JC676]|uniref:DUF924 family protein n=1 Tax=Sphingomonas sp. JC676 TaxID=2768065 RepID=UPI0016582DDD|nr:DUF924 family protein [Sphingomonas sp. JC676]MBC9032087.1 DUF924 domain-containing protein [Sphingomonas sp. JC676]
MASDLGATAPEVHARAREVLGFWFDLLMPEQWFGGSHGLDAEISTLFGSRRDEVLASGAADWRGDPETLLAAVILLDQFSRNIHRDTAKAFAADPLARDLATLAVERGWDQALPPERRQFLYLPFQHGESRELQAVSLRCFEALGLEEPLTYAIEHAEVIARFGRFPTRNAALGRESTPEEKAYLSQPGVGW